MVDTFDSSTIYGIILGLIIFVPVLANLVSYHFTKKEDTLPGLVRSLMGLSLIFILGVSVFHLVMDDTDNDTDEKIISVTNNVLAILSGGVTAIIGFHFGGQQTRQAMETSQGFGKSVTDKPSSIK